jgi:uncharacterized protein YqjF (DUF2071 family)
VEISSVAVEIVWRTARRSCGFPVDPLRKSVFLRAAWRGLVLVNFEADPALLRGRVPPGTELDSFGGRCLVSLVGFQFQGLRVLGLPVSRDFAEVNLRYYVRREDERGLVRGVAFVRELVPRPLVAWGARTLYNEPYLCCSVGRPGPGVYFWRVGGEHGGLHAAPEGPFALPASGSEEEFVVEHYYGYGRARNGRTLEYEVRHPPWGVARPSSAGVSGSTAVFGREFEPLLGSVPVSAFVAEGSFVEVCFARTLPGVPGHG